MPYRIGIVDVDDPKYDILIQTDWNHPGVASTFGWSVTDLQCCRKCQRELVFDDQELQLESEVEVQCEDCRRKKGNVFCDHAGTDGTIDCTSCGVPAGRFIQAAAEFLYEADGEETEDPGYFS